MEKPHRSEQGKHVTDRTLPIVCGLVVFTAAHLQAARPDGALEVTVVDAESGEPVAARMELKRSGGRPARSRGLGVAPLGDHFYVDGQTELGLRRGNYEFDLTAGPEYKPISGRFEIERRASDSKRVEMHRVVRLGEEGWFGADLLAARGGLNLDAALRGEGLRYTPLTSWRSDGGGWDDVPSAESDPDTRVAFGPWAARSRADLGDLLLVSPDAPLTREQLKPITDGGADALAELRDQGVRVVAADAASWRLPVWLAADLLDAVVVIDPSDQRAGRKARSWGRPPDRDFYSGARGPALWREAIYFHILSAGLPIPPAAGSNTGDNELPLGACRTYARQFEGFSTQGWWDALADGNAMVTNGPLLRPIPAPGERYRLMDDNTEVTLGLSLTTRSKVDYLEVVKNGQVEHSVSLRELAEARGEMPPIDCSGSGWFVLRAIAMESPGYERGMTAPYYYQPLDGEPRISRASCEFFLAWLKEAEGKLSADELAMATQFWQERIAAANAP